MKYRKTERGSMKYPLELKQAEFARMGVKKALRLSRGSAHEATL